MDYSNYLKIIIFFFLWAVYQLGWAQTGRLTIEECKELALQHNRKLKSAGLEIDAAKAAKRSTDANAYPALEGSIMGIYLGDPIGGAMGGMIPELMANGSVSASMPIYAGGKIRLGKTAAQKVVEIAEEQKKLTDTEVLLEVEKAYWQVVQVQEKVKLAEKYGNMLKALHADLQNSYDAGMIYKNDLLRVGVSLNESELSIAAAKDGVAMAKLQLAQIIGMVNDTDFAVIDSVGGNFLPSEKLEGYAEDRPEIRILNKTMEAQGLQKRILKSDFLPTIGLSVSGIGVLGKGVNISTGKNNMVSYYGIASISIPILDWGKKSNNIKEQAFKIAAREEQLEETKELISMEVQSAYLTLNQSARKVRYKMLSLEQADENLKLTEDRYQAGTIVGKDVLEAQAIWQEAFSELIDAKIEYKIREASYKKALGTDMINTKQLID